MRKYICAVVCSLAPLSIHAASLGSLGNFPPPVSDTRVGLTPGSYDDYYTFFAVADTADAIISFSLVPSGTGIFQAGAFSIELYAGVSSPAGSPIASGLSGGGQSSVSFSADLVNNTTYTVRTAFSFGVAGTDVAVDATTQVSPIPVPAAVWLLGSGLLGLVGVVGKKRRH